MPVRQPKGVPAGDDDWPPPRPRRSCIRSPPSKPTRGNTSVSLGPSKQVPGEDGLYAAASVPAGATVCSFEYVSWTYSQSMRYLQSTGLRAFEDAGLQDRDRVLWDPGFTSPDQIPVSSPSFAALRACELLHWELLPLSRLLCCCL